MTGEPMHTAYKMVPHTPVILSEKSSIYYASLSANVNPLHSILNQELHSILNQELFKRHLCNPCIPKERTGAMFPSYQISSEK